MINSWNVNFNRKENGKKILIKECNHLKKVERKKLLKEHKI